MNRMRTWSLGTAVVAILVLLAGWFLLVSPAKGKVSDLHTQTATQLQTNSTLQTQIDQLKLQNKNLPKQEAKLAEIRQHLPVNPNLPKLLTNLTRIAHESGVQLVSATPAAPAPVTVAAPAVVTPSASSSASASATTDPNSAATATDAPVAPVAVAPSSPLRMIPVTISVTGGYYNLIRFLTKVEGLQRSMLIYGMNITPATKIATDTSTGQKITAILNARIFFSPEVAAVTTPAAPAASGTAAPATAS